MGTSRRTHAGAQRATCGIPTTLLPPATRLEQGNIFRSVCQEFCSRGGGCVYPIACWDTHTPPGAHPLGPEADTPRHTTHPPGADTPSGPEADTSGSRPLLHSACWDTVNKRAVRIPLECFLVLVIVASCNSKLINKTWETETILMLVLLRFRQTGFLQHKVDKYHW